MSGTGLEGFARGQQQAPSQMEPMQMLQAYRSGMNIPTYDTSRPAQFLPPSLPQFNYSAQRPTQGQFGQPQAQVYVPMGERSSNWGGAAGPGTGTADGDGGAAAAASADSSGMGGIGIGGDGGAGGGGK
jgi:hypothetical protein